jgi:hypothetical protein
MGAIEGYRHGADRGSCKQKGKAMPQSMIEHLDLADVQAFLAAHVDPHVQDVAAAGAGAWSRCFRFRSAERDLVVRFGQHVDDFLKDRLAAAYAAPGLPIPQVLTIGPAFDGHYAISTRVIGEPLEQVSLIAYVVGAGLPRAHILAE